SCTARLAPITAAGDSPCVLLMVGARIPGRTFNYPEQGAKSPQEAYVDQPQWRPGRRPDAELRQVALTAVPEGSGQLVLREIDGRVVGHIASFDLEGRREVTYWIGREDWGRGIATRALQEFLQLEATRPLYAGAASDNAASIRVLTKCGFVIVGEGRGFAYGRNEETDEVVLRLDA